MLTHPGYSARFQLARASKKCTHQAMSSSLEPRRVSQSCVQMTEIVLPGHTNQLGTIFGGQLMAWIDIAGSIAASRHARGVCVTASIDALHFLAPVRLGQHISIRASVNYTGRTSMEVGARLESETPDTGERTYVAKAYLTFVAIDAEGKARQVAPIVPETEDERRRYRDAELRRASRLDLKAALLQKTRVPHEGP
jgi:acyl-CoA hydrolase